MIEFNNNKEFMEYVYASDYDKENNFVDLKRLSPRSKKIRKELGTTYQEYLMKENNRKLIGEIK
jgi:hypothetical protein